MDSHSDTQELPVVVDRVAGLLQKRQDTWHPSPAQEGPWKAWRVRVLSEPEGLLSLESDVKGHFPTRQEPDGSKLPFTQPKADPILIGARGNSQCQNDPASSFNSFSSELMKTPA